MTPKHDSMTRRSFVAGISTVAGVAAGLAVGPAEVAGEERGVAERLNAIGNELEQTGARLDRIAAAFTDAPDTRPGANPPDTRPGIVDALGRVRREAEDIVITADDMLQRLPPR
jgi:hypothetical protein